VKKMSSQLAFLIPTEADAKRPSPASRLAGK